MSANQNFEGLTVDSIRGYTIDEITENEDGTFQLILNKAIEGEENLNHCIAVDVRMEALIQVGYYNKKY